jgi:PKD repeat protein
VALWSLLAVIGLAALLASPAGAVVIKLNSGKILSYLPTRADQPRAAATQQVNYLPYGGGPVMPANTNYALYWRPDNGPAYQSDYQPGLNQYFADVAHDSGMPTDVDSVGAQLNDTLGEFADNTSFFGGPLADTDPYPPNGCKNAKICLTDNQIRNEVAQYIAANNLPADLSHEYFVLTPPGVEVCFDAAGTACSAGAFPNPDFCAYHGFSSTTNPSFVYAVVPDYAGNYTCDNGEHPNGTSSDGVLSGLSHEHLESMTDPIPNIAWTDWATGQNTGYEIGDKCEWGPQYGTPLGTGVGGAPYNQIINGHHYLLQEEWSNQTHQCLQRIAFKGTAPIGYFSSTPVTGLTMRFNTTGSSAAGGIGRYTWQFNDNAPQYSQQTTTVRAVTHTFPRPGLYPVALTVFAHDGTSIGTFRWVLVGTAGPTPAFTATTLGPHAGAPVSFTGAPSKDPHGSIGEYLWTFGDHSGLAFGETPTHTYANPGVYRVTLTIADSAGQQASLTKLVTVK